MSMLAERKTKQKWSLNPRGNDWVQDSNKFGQKMLEKMGWQHGKGLGAKEDGITEHVKVSYKNDSKGMGYKESNDQWTEHESNFSALLESLSGEKPDEVKLNSLEKKSQNSRARVHYHKFTRGKDLSRYSEKDLANIFGKKSLKESSKIEETQGKPNGSEEKNADNKFLFNAGSMRDYFKKKLLGFGKSNGYVVGQNGVLRKEESDSESNPSPSFGFNSGEKDDGEVSYAGFGFKSEFISDTNGDTESKITNNKSTFVSYVNGNYDEESNEKKSKKKRKAEEKNVDNVFSPKKKSRKNKEDPSKHSVKEGCKEEGIANPAFNPLQTPVKIEKHVLDTIEESISEDISDPEDSVLKYGMTTVQVHASTQEKKEYLSESSCSNLEAGESTIEVKKKSKSKGLENGVVNSVFIENDTVDLTAVNVGKENEVEISPFEVKRKESKKNKQVKSKKKENRTVQNNNNNIDLRIEEPKKITATYENPNFEEAVEDLSHNLQIKENPYELKPKKSKKKKQENPSIDLTTDNSGVSSITEVPLKQKSKKKENRTVENNNNNIDLTIEEPKETTATYENLNFEEPVEDLSHNLQIKENPYEVKPKKSKKKKQENPSIDLTTDDSGTSSITEIPSKQKSKKKDKTFALENPNFDDSLENTIDLTEAEENPYEVKVKRKKTKGGIDNVNFIEMTEGNASFPQNEENPFEVARNKRKKKKNENYAIENPNFNESLEETECAVVKENPYEIKPKKKKKKKDYISAIDNPNFNANNSIETSTEKIPFEVQRKQKKVKGNKENVKSILPDVLSSDIKENISLDIEENDLMLNVVSTPIIARTPQANGENSHSVMKINSVKRRKSVRFSDVTQERIIPNNEDLRNLSDTENRNELFKINTQVINNSLEEQNISFDMSALDKFSYDSKKKKLGIDNTAFDKHKTNLEENLDSISKTIDRYQAEIENDINEKKLETITMEDVMVGEVGNPHGEHERLPEGTKLKFKYANFISRTPFYHLDKTGAKKSYKHLIKGDIVVGFKNTNLHEIQGYAAKSTSTNA
ncbi:dual specificity protein kinase splB [Anoplophora glabripennis]|nr:dual specificity protein kinase splB [Anoplophora glabripennis]